MMNYVNQVQPLEHKRLSAVMECMKFSFLQNVAMRGGSREDFEKNYDDYSAFKNSCQKTSVR